MDRRNLYKALALRLLLAAAGGASLTSVVCTAASASSPVAVAPVEKGSVADRVAAIRLAVTDAKQSAKANSVQLADGDFADTFHDNFHNSSSPS